MTQQDRLENRLARWTGLAYLVVIATGFFSQGYVPGKISAPGQPEVLLANIVTHEALFRAGVAAALVEYASFLAVPILLFRLLGATHRGMGVAMVALALPGVPIALIAVSHHLDALLLLTDPRGLPLEQAHAMARLSLKSHASVMLAANLFWGLWLLPFGFLVLRCGRLPRVIGVLLMLGCAGYVVDVFGQLLLPGYAEMSFPDYLNLPAAVGEVGIALWLLLRGMARGAAQELAWETT